MIAINVRDNAAELSRHLSATAREQVPFATALALTRTAKALERSTQMELGQVFNNPTPFVARGTFSTSANKRELTATVGMRDRTGAGRAGPAMYVKESFSGGARDLKPFERALKKLGALPEGYKAVPGYDLKTDRYGSPDRKKLTEIIGALSSGFSIYSGRGKRTALVGYFVVMPGAGGRAAHFKYPGIFRRLQRGDGRAVQCMFVFQTTASYDKRIELPALARAVVTRDFGIFLRGALAQAQGRPR